MPFLTINGQRVSVAIGKANRNIVKRGRRKRAYRGQMRDGTRGKRRELIFQACFQDFEFAETLIGVINGDGHIVHFRDGWDAATSLQPEIGDLSDTRFDPTAVPFAGFPPGALFSEGSGLTMRYDAQMPPEATLHVWTKEDVNVWKPHTMRTDGIVYADGVRDDTLFSLGGISPGNINFSVRDGRLDMIGQGGDPTLIAHMAILPYLAHTDFVESWHASTTPWSGLPVLRVEGDALLTDHELFFGEVTGVGYIGHGRDVAPFGWINNAQIVEFKLMEVAQGFIFDDTVPAP